MEIIPNPLLVALQAVPFLVTIVGLYHIIFKPMLNYLDGRTRAIEDGRREAEQLQAQVAERMADYEDKLSAARAQVATLRATRRGEALQAYEARIKRARGEADAKIQQALVTIGTERVAARAELETTARGLAGQIAGAVLGRSLAAGAK